jgi:hypothetical protein
VITGHQRKELKGLFTLLRLKRAVEARARESQGSDEQ